MWLKPKELNQLRKQLAEANCNKWKISKHGCITISSSWQSTDLLQSVSAGKAQIYCSLFQLAKHRFIAVSSSWQSTDLLQSALADCLEETEEMIRGFSPIKKISYGVPAGKAQIYCSLL